METQYIIKDIDHISAVADKIWQQLSKSRNSSNIILFKGEMGAGKTTLIRAICESAGVVDNVTSPTFAIVNEYSLSESDDAIYHFDFYRIESIREVYDLGYEEYFYSGHLCFIEWPSKIWSLLESVEQELGITTIEIVVNDKQHREVNIDVNSLG